MLFSILRLDPRTPAASPATPSQLFSAALEMSAWADEQGFEMIALPEHHGTDDGYLPSPVVMASCIAGRTERVRIGIIALLLPLYDPVRLAEDLAVLDIASGGRVSIVAGLGYRPEEYSMLDKDWDGRGKLMDECLEVLLRCWQEDEPFEWRGRRVHVTPKPLTQPHPPVSVGGMGRNAARRAARFRLPFQPAVNTPEVLAFYQEECKRVGFETPLVIPPGEGVMIYVSQDPDRTWDEIGRYLLYDATTYASWQPENHRSAVHSDATTVEALRAEGKYRILTPDECVDYAKSQGEFAAISLFPLCGGTPPDLAWPSLELYASQVLPRLAAR